MVNGEWSIVKRETINVRYFHPINVTAITHRADATTTAEATVSVKCETINVRYFYPINVTAITHRVDAITTAQATVAQKLDQGERKKSAVYLFFLDFLVLLRQGKRTGNNFIEKNQTHPKTKSSKHFQKQNRNSTSC